MTIFIVCVVIANLKVLTLSYKKSIGLILSIILGISSFYLVSAIAQLLFPYSDMRGVLQAQLSSPYYWLCILSSAGLIFTFEAIIKRYKQLVELEQRTRVEFI